MIGCSTKAVIFKTLIKCYILKYCNVQPKCFSKNKDMRGDDVYGCDIN